MRQRPDETRRTRTIPNPTAPGSAPFSWPPPLDLNQPSLALTGLSDGQTMSGTETIRAVATDDVGVSRLEFLLDIHPQPVKNSSIPIINGVPAAFDHAAPYGFTWDTSCVPNGTHTITARAVDTSGRHVETVPIEVTVDNPPPQPGQVVCGAGVASAALPLVRRCRVFWISRCYRNEKKPSLGKKAAPAKKKTTPAKTAPPATQPPPAPHTGHWIAASADPRRRYRGNDFRPHLPSARVRPTLVVCTASSGARRRDVEDPLGTPRGRGRGRRPRARRPLWRHRRRHKRA